MENGKKRPKQDHSKKKENFTVPGNNNTFIKET